MALLSNSASRSQDVSYLHSNHQLFCISKTHALYTRVWSYVYSSALISAVAWSSEFHLYTSFGRKLSPMCPVSQSVPSQTYHKRCFNSLVVSEESILTAESKLLGGQGSAPNPTGVAFGAPQTSCSWTWRIFPAEGIKGRKEGKERLLRRRRG